MIPSPRIAVVDDDPASVKAIRESLEKLGTACLPVLVQAGRPSVPNPVRGIRLLFLDIHLVSGGQSGAALYDICGAIAEQVLAKDNGPYVLVIWTSHKDERKALLSHLSAHYPALPQPLASLEMAKEDFLQGGGFDSARLAERIAELLKSQPQANALLHWEDAVDAACGDLISVLMGFISRGEMFLGTANEKLERLLTAIAQRSVGARNVSDDVLAAINEGFVPLLLDRLSHIPDKNEKLAEKWTAAVTKPDTLVSMDLAESASLNGMHHIASAISGEYKPGMRGAIYELPENYDLSVLITGIDPNKLLDTYIQRKDGTPDGLATLKSKIRWCLVGLRAACDQAQQNVGLHRLLLALRIPDPIGVKGFGPLKHGASHCSMPMLIDGHVSKFVFNFHYLVTLTESQFNAMKVKSTLRFRENFCGDLENRFAAHASRPGLIDMTQR